MDENKSDLLAIPKGSIVLNANNVSEDLIKEHSSDIENRHYWHAFLIHNVKNPNRNEILKIILNYVYPEALLPTHFRSKGTDCAFLARNCYGAISKILKNNLVIPDPNTSQSFACELILKFSTVSDLPLPASNISSVLKLLYEGTSKTLNLEKFSDNQGLLEYNPLSQPKLLCFALRISDEMKPAFIKLNNNEIKTLSPFEVLRGLSSVKRLDLRNNLIEDVEELEYLKDFDLIELWLDGNPICEKFDALSYVQSIKKIMPTLEKLDGVSIGLPRLPMPQQNFLCSNEGFDLVDQFVNHFFSLYDSEREILKDLYHPSAMFSMTTECSPVNRVDERMSIYGAFNTNLLKRKSSLHECAIGNNEILNTFSKLPRTKHNKETFSVDLFHYSKRSAVLSIYGTFCEDSKQFQHEVIFGFKRTFTLIKHASDYVIYNELLHIYKASDVQMRDTLEKRQVKAIPQTFSVVDKTMAVEAMSRVTGVNILWIKRLLEDANYNIITFLRTFTTLLKRDQIPNEAYSQNNQGSSLMEWFIPKMIEFGMRKFENSLQQEALNYISKNPSFLTNIVDWSTNLLGTVAPRDIQQQYWMQEYGCHNLEMSMNSNYSNHPMVQGIPNQYGYATQVSEYSFQSSEILQYHIPHPKKNRNKRSISDVENIAEIQTKKSMCIMSTPKINPCQSIENSNKEPIAKHQDNIHNRPNLILVPTKNNNLVDPIKPISPEGSDLKKNTKESKIDKPRKKTHTQSISKPMKLCDEKIHIEIRPKLALLDRKWNNVEACDEYDFQLAFNKWILVQKGVEGKWFSKQDDFQKNFTCWKKHFPTYSNEELGHSLQASCISSHLKSVFNTIEFPVTYWDFPATVPEDMRPPMYTFSQKDGTEKLITPGCGYGFIYVDTKWICVFRNNLNIWMIDDKTKILWKNNEWVTEEYSIEEKVAESPNGNEPSSPETKVILNNNIEEDPFIICDHEEQELDTIDLEIAEKSNEEMKSIYAEDIAPEETITTSNYAFHTPHATDKEKLCIGAEKSTQSHIADRLDKWKKLFEFVPHIPKIVLMKGDWIVVCKKENLKFYRTQQNKWVLMEKKSGTNEWQVVYDDFSVDNGSGIPLSNRIGKNIFDLISMPVTMYDFTASVPSNLLPPEKLVTGKQLIRVTPNSGYAYVSVNGQWIAVKKNEQHKWVAVHDVNKTKVEKKLTNVPDELSDNKTVLELESDDDKKIIAATCTLLEIITGTKSVKPLTHRDIKGSEEKRPPRLALTEIDGEQQWRYVTPGCGKGFILEDGVWVKVVLSSGEWKATQFRAYQGCILGYYLFNNIWMTMKKFILGGKWSPVCNIETTPTTYWNYIGPEELKPPKKVHVSKAEKIVHNNSNLGFIKIKDFWILMEKKDDHWKVFKEGQNFCIYKIIDGTWKKIGRNSTGKSSIEPKKQKLSTYQNFSGLMTYAPPKQLNFTKGDTKIKKIIDEQSGMGFIMKDGVWVLMQLNNESVIPVKNSKGEANFGFKLVDGKFKIFRTDENGQWINLESAQQKVKIHERSISLDQKFKDAIPLTHDRILIDFPTVMKPPKYALMKDFIKNKIYWHLVDENSGYGFTRENDSWMLMKWTSDKNWVNSSNDSGVEYIYKNINNRWIPMKKEDDKWIPIFDPINTPKIPDLCIESPERDLPSKIELQTNNSMSKMNVTPFCGMGYIKYSDEYVLMNLMLSGNWVVFEHSNGNALIFKVNDTGQWIRSTRCVKSFKIEKNVSEKIGENEIVSTYSNTEGNNYTKPPRFIKLMEGGITRWKEIGINDGFGFVKRKYWILVKKIEGNWMIVDKNEAYNIIDNRWLPMKKIKDEWLPSFDPFQTPRCSLDSVNDSVFPNRVITYDNGFTKYINIANDCSLGFTVDKPKVYILKKEQDGTWITMKDDFQEAPTMAFKWIKSKWQRMKKDGKTDQWILCKKQFDLPVLHLDIIGKPDLQPPSEISVHDSNNKECKMSFNIFSNEGFLKQQDIWVLMKPADSGWTTFPGIFGCYGYKVVNDKLIVMEKRKGRWEACNQVDIPILHPVRYKDTEGWPEIERPPMVLFLPHNSLLVRADEDTCQYGFVKNKDVWLVAKKSNQSWNFMKINKKHIAYKLINKRWVTMEMNILNDWIPTFNPSCTPYTYFNTAGEFEERPPLRIILNDPVTWTAICIPTKFGFFKDNNMWVVMKKNNNVWIQYVNNKEQLGYKIEDGQWRRYTKPAHGTWRICSNPFPPVLSCDFTPNNKNAPPSSLGFGSTSKADSLKYICAGFNSAKGFIEDNGAWILMQTCQKVWQKVDRFPWLKGTFAYMLKNDNWRIVKRDLDGSWKCGFINNKGPWMYEHLPNIPVKIPLSDEDIKKLPVQDRPPEVFIIYIDNLPKLVALKSVKNNFAFQNYKEAWVLLERTKYWKIAGGVIAYKLINSRWVTMEMRNNQWAPLYDPVDTPITHFECADSFQDSKPPLRIALNENGKEIWKVIFQNSGYGFIEHDNMWVLMKKQCDGTWKKHKDYLLEFTAYKMVDKKWTRFKKTAYGDWIRMDSSLPALHCDFSVLHSQKPPPSFKKSFLFKPRNTQGSITTFLDLFSKFGFRQDNNVWILMNCDHVGSWSEYKLHPKETELFGYMLSGGVWKLVKKSEDGSWESGTLKHINIEGHWTFIKDETALAQQRTTNKYEHQVKVEQKSEHKNKQELGDTTEKSKEGKEEKHKIITKVENKNIHVLKLENNGDRYENKGRIDDKNDREVYDKNRHVNFNLNEDKIGRENGEVYEANKLGVNNITEHEVVDDGKTVVNNESQEKVEGKNVEVSEKEQTTFVDETIGGENVRVHETNELEVNNETEYEVGNKSKSVSVVIYKKETTVVGTKIDKEEKTNAEDEIEQQFENEETSIKKVLPEEQEANDENSKTAVAVNDELADETKRVIENENYEENEKEQKFKHQNDPEVHDKNKRIVQNENVEDVNEHKVEMKTESDNEKEVEDQNVESIRDKNEQGVKDIMKKELEVNANIEEIFKKKNSQIPDDLIGNKQEVEETKETVEVNSVPTNKIVIEEETEEKNYSKCKQNEKENMGECTAINHSYEIPLTNPVKYHELAEFPIEAKPPKNVCLKVRGVHRRISLISKKSKIGFQHHKGVWVLLENLTGTWKILHNSAGFPLAYKLIDNRWISMRMDKNGSWLPTCNPITTPRTYFDTEGPEDTKPPRRVILNENGVLKWKEISEFSGLGFVKNENMWILMRNPSNNDWTQYRNDKQEICAFKVQDFKWTKFTQGADGDWKISEEDLPLLSYDYVGSSEAAPPEFTPYLQKITKKEAGHIGFLWNSGAWIMMECNEHNNWTPILDTDCTYGFEHAEGKLWNVVRKDYNGKWKKVEMNRSFQSILEDLLKIDSKREKEILETSNKRIKIESINSTSSSDAIEHNNMKQKVLPIEKYEGKSSTKNDSIEIITTPGQGVIQNHSSPSNITNSSVSILKEKTTNEKNVLSEAAMTLDQTELLCKTYRDLKQMELQLATYSLTEDDNSPNQVSISAIELAKPKNICEEQMKPETQDKISQNQAKLNSVELYLAVKPDCCLGCPELQNLLREYRPSNVPNKIIRKEFRLPDGSMRMLTIPKAVPDSQKPIEAQVNLRKRRNIDTEKSSNKKRKCNK